MVAVLLLPEEPLSTGKRGLVCRWHISRPIFHSLSRLPAPVSGLFLNRPGRPDGSVNRKSRLFHHAARSSACPDRHCWRRYSTFRRQPLFLHFERYRLSQRFRGRGCAPALRDRQRFQFAATATRPASLRLRQLWSPRRYSSFKLV